MSRSPCCFKVVRCELNVIYYIVFNVVNVSISAPITLAVVPICVQVGAAPLHDPSPSHVLIESPAIFVYPASQAYVTRLP